MSERPAGERVEWYALPGAQRTPKRFKAFHARATRHSDPTFSHEFTILRRRIGRPGAVCLSFADDEPKPAAPTKVRVSPIEVALVYRRLLEEAPGRTQADVGRMIGRTNARVNQLLSLLKLDPEILEFLLANRDPDTIGCFTERRLRILLRIRRTSERLSRFMQMRNELDRRRSGQLRRGGVSKRGGTARPRQQRMRRST